MTSHGDSAEVVPTAELEAGQPYASIDAFLTRYADVAPAGDRDAAALYLVAE